MSQDLVTESEQRAAAARRRLMAVVADLDPDDGEMRTLQWLLWWETHTVDNIAALFERARAAGYRAGTGTLA